MNARLLNCEILTKKHDFFIVWDNDLVDYHIFFSIIAPNNWEELPLRNFDFNSRLFEEFRINMEEETSMKKQ